MYICTPRHVAIALDPVTGREVWKYDAKVGQSKLRQHQTGRAYYDYQGEELRLTYSTSYPSPLTGVAGGYWSTAA